MAGSDTDIQTGAWAIKIAGRDWLHEASGSLSLVA